MTLGRSAPEELWALLSVEYRWLSALGASIDWFKEQTQGVGPDKFGNLLKFDFNYSLTNGGRSFADWIKKSCRHAVLQHKIQTHWKEWHHAFLQQCATFGLQISFPWTLKNVTRRKEQGEACINWEIFHHKSGMGGARFQGSSASPCLPRSDWLVYLM